MIRKSFEFVVWGSNYQNIEAAAVERIASVYGLTIEEVPGAVDMSIRVEVESEDRNGKGETVSVYYSGYVDGRIK